MLAAATANANGSIDFRDAQFASRITSYNVCYTKLLRILTRRASLLERLYDNEDPALIRV